MLGFIGDALGAILSGGMTGLLGSGISLFFEMKKQKMMFEHDVKMAQVEQDRMRLQAELKMETTKVEGEVKVQTAEMEAFSNSHKNDRATYTDTSKLGKLGNFMLMLVDILRGIIRPGMTIYMTVLTTFIYIEVMELVAPSGGTVNAIMSQSAAAELLQQLIMVILYITSTVVLWWFGTRQKVIKPPSIG